MDWKDDFKRGKKAGKKHPNSHDADLDQIEGEENHKMAQKKEALLLKKADIENEIKECESKLNLIRRFLEEVN